MKNMSDDIVEEEEVYEDFYRWMCEHMDDDYFYYFDDEDYQCYYEYINDVRLDFKVDKKKAWNYFVSKFMSWQLRGMGSHEFKKWKQKGFDHEFLSRIQANNDSK